MHLGSTMDTASRLLNIPTEVRLLMFDHAFAALPRRRKALDGNAGHWVPPPFINICRQIRMEAIEAFFKVAISFEIHELDMSKVIRQRLWRRRVAAYYRIALPKEEVVFYNIRDAEFTEKTINNLWTWLREFHAYRVEAQFMYDDIKNEQKMGGQVEILEPQNMKKLEQYVVHSHVRELG